MSINQCFCKVLRLIALPLLISTFLLYSALLSIGHAQVTTAITPDGTMGTTVTINGNVYDIDGGNQQGTNLFQSFGLFSVGEGDIASFNGPPSIANILSRVTGGVRSDIYGTLRSTIDGANLYLFNPSGVVFGPNASLDVSGSFHVSTADYLGFGNGAEFHADLSKGSTLTVAEPAAFGFLGDNPAAISFDQSSLQVPEDETLSVIGGDINVEGGSLNAPGGQINIASVASPGEVIPNTTGNSPSLQVDSFEQLGEISLSRNRYIDTSSSEGGGTVVIRGGRFMMDDSRMFADTLGDVDGTPTGIDIQITHDMVLTNGSYITTDLLGGGDAGTIQLSAKSLEVSNDAVVWSRAFSGSTGNAGDINIKATDSVNISESLISSNTSGEGNAGNIHLDVANLLSIVKGSRISTNTSYTGKGGDITIQAGEIVLHGPSLLGDGAELAVILNILHTWDSDLEIELISPSGNPVLLFSGIGGSSDNFTGTKLYDLAALSIMDGSAPFTGTFRPMEPMDNMIGESVSGEWTLEINDTYPWADSGTLQNWSLIVGDGMAHTSDMAISIVDNTVSTLSVDADPGVVVEAVHNIPTTISTTSTGTGQGGTIFITTTERLAISGKDSGLFTKAENNGVGGDIVLQTTDVTLTDNATISTASSVNTGNITITAEDTVNISGSSVSSQAHGEGNAGTIVLDVGNLTLANNGYIRADAIEGSSGNAGNIEIEATDSVNISHSYILSSTFGEGNAGNITLNTENFTLNNRGFIRAGSRNDNSGKGGNITITAIDSAMISNSGIMNQVWGIGDGGNIQLDVGNLTLTERGMIDSNVWSTGNAGNITINADSVNISGFFEGRRFSSDITSSTWGEGNAGNIQLVVGSLNLADLGMITTSVQGDSPGKGGNITITATDSVNISGEGIISSSTWGKGDAGTIVLDVGNLTLADSGVISTTSGSSSSGKAGDLTIIAKDSVNISHGLITSDTSGEGDAGTIVLDVGSLNLTNVGRIRANASSSGKAGDITIMAKDTVNISSSSSISSTTSGEGNAGTIVLDVGNLNLTGFSASISTDTRPSSSGKAGDLTIIAKDSVNISGIIARISSDTQGQGDAGTIVLDVDNLNITDSGSISSRALDDSSGNAGVINITATDSVIISGESFVSSTTFAEGSAGTIELVVGNLTLTDSGSIITNTNYSGSGKGGDITIKATDSVNISESRISSNTSGEGDGGTIVLDVGNLTLTNDGSIRTDSFFSSGKAGDINITATDSVNISKSRIISSTRGIGKGDKYGDAGTIVLDVGNLSLTDTSHISTDATEYKGNISSGKAGGINITATDSVNMSGESFVSSSALGEGDGGIVTISASDTFQSDNSTVKTSAEQAEGGDINITAARDVLLRNGTIVSAESSGEGDAGNISINAGNTYLSENSSVTTEARNASGGDIHLTAQYMAHMINSEISSSVGGEADTAGGNITMNQHYGVLDNSKIIAQANEGSGGNIRITAGVFLTDPNSIVSASSASGIDGQVDINAPVTNISGDISSLQENYSSADSLLLKPCAVRMSGGQQSSLVAYGRDGLPVQPGDLLPSPLYVAAMVEDDAKVADLWDKPALSYGMNAFEEKGLLPLAMLDNDSGCSSCPE
jgi:filamentous hemagglutinin family protein